MKALFQKTINYLAYNPRKLFLIDALGALLTAFMLGIVLVHFESVFRMPKKTLYYLAAVACVFAVYSITCYALFGKNWKTYLQIIAIANFLYCCITLSLVFYLQNQLSALGTIYFLLEIIIVMGLVVIELSSISKSTP